MTSRFGFHKMARVAKRVDKKQNSTARQKNKAKNKSKYFNKTKKNTVEQAGKHIKQTKPKSGKGEKLPSLEPLFTSNSTMDYFNPQLFGKRLTREFFDEPTENLAVALLGKILCRQTEQGVILCGKIVETEAYLGIIDPACHAYGGKKTARNAPMYGLPGTAYVYFIYGMYHCFNISSKEDGACVLIRALEPLKGHTCMRQFRDAKRKESAKSLKDHELANGPSKLCTAMDISKKTLNNTDMVFSKKFWVGDASLIEAEEFTVVHTTRIGINSYGQEAAEKLYRYYILGNKNVSVRDKHAETKLAAVPK